MHAFHCQTRNCLPLSRTITQDSALSYDLWLANVGLKGLHMACHVITVLYAFLSMFCHVVTNLHTCSLSWLTVNSSKAHSMPVSPLRQ